MKRCCQTLQPLRARSGRMGTEVDYQTLSVMIDDEGVAKLTLNRPDQRNAMSALMMDELTTFAGQSARDPAIRVVVLSGSAGVFCAGGDLKWMMAQIEADRATRMSEARRLAEMLKALNEMPVPLIGKVEGYAMGGGLGLVSICDAAVAANECRFAFSETRLGIIPATISPYVMARMGEGAARRVFMNARTFDGAEAVTLGIVSRTVSSEELDSTVEAEMRPYLSLPKGAVGRAKALTRMLGVPIDKSVIDRTIERLADAWETEEAREGIAAFLEKRPPRWAG